MSVHITTRVTSVQRFESPDLAAVSSVISCYHWLAGKMLLTPVRYTDEAVRTDGVWKIAGRKIYATRFWIAEGYAPDPLDPTLGRRI